MAEKDSNICMAHSGCISDIKNLKSDKDVLFSKYNELDRRVDTIMGRINVILGGILVSLVILVIQLIVTMNGGG